MITVYSARDDAYEAFVEAHPHGHLFQSEAWGRVKSEWVWRGIAAADAAGNIRGAISLLIRKMPLLPVTLVYAPRGPVCDPEDTAVIQELAQAVIREAKRHRAYAVRLDPDVKSDSADVLTAALREVGFRLLPPAKNFEHIQPQYVVRLDLLGKTKQELLAAFKSKTRYNIRVAERRGVEVRLAGVDALDDFYPIMVQTGERDQFGIRSKEYFRRMLTALGDRARLYMAYADGTPIAGTLAACFGDKVWYFYGASANAHRELMPNYLLQWRMIEWAVDRGCRLYDFRGISGDTSGQSALGGLWRFKSGWNGEFTEFVGEYVFVLHPIANLVIERAIPLARRFLQRMRRLLRAR